MPGYSYFEMRFYIGVVFLFAFGFLALILVLAGEVLEGIILLGIVVLGATIAYFTNKMRCPHCNRLIDTWSYEVCPFCGYRLRGKNTDITTD